MVILSDVTFERGWGDGAGDVDLERGAGFGLSSLGFLEVQGCWLNGLRCSRISAIYRVVGCMA